MKVTLDKEPISAAELDRRLLAARRKAAAVHEYIAAAESEIGLTNGDQYSIHHRDLKTLETTLDMALMYAESLLGQVKKEAERLSEEP